MEEAGLEPRVEHCAYHDATGRRSGAAAVERLLAARPRVDALFVGAGDLATARPRRRGPPRAGDPGRPRRSWCFDDHPVLRPLLARAHRREPADPRPRPGRVRHAVRADVGAAARGARAHPAHAARRARVVRRRCAPSGPAALVSWRVALSRRRAAVVASPRRPIAAGATARPAVVFEELKTAGVSLRHGAEPHGAQAPARDDDLGRRPPRLRRRRLARRLRRQRRDDAAASTRRDPTFRNRLFRNRGDWQLRGRDREGRGRRARATSWASAAADYDNDGHTDLFVAGLRAERPLPQPRRRHLRGRDRERPASRSPTPTTARCGRWRRPSSTTTTTAGSTSSSRTTASGTRRRSRVCNRPEAPRLLPPRRLQGPARTRSSATTATARSRTSRSPTRHPRARRQGHGPRRRRLRRRRLDGRLRRERQRAGLPLPQPRRRRRSRRSASRPASPTPRRGEPISGMGADARDVDDDGRPDIFQTAPRRRDDAALPEPGRHDASRTGPPAPGVVVAQPLATGLEQRHRRLQQRRLEGPLRGRRRRHGPEGRLPRARAAQTNTVFVEPRRTAGSPTRLGGRGRGLREPQGASTAARPSATSTTTAASTSS